MLYDRPYMRQDSAPAAPKTSIVTRLLIITIGVAVVTQLLSVFVPSLADPTQRFIGEQMAISGENFRELKVWTLLTYGFFHSPAVMSVMFIPIPYAHLLLNMLGLYVFGRQTESTLGAKRFLALYFGAILAGGLLYSVLHFNDQPLLINGTIYAIPTAIGASAAISAIIGFFAMINPNAKIILFPIPIPLKAKWLLYGFGAITLFGTANELSSTGGGIAHSAHLGGLLFGLAFHRYVYLGNAIPFLNPSSSGSESSTTTAEPPSWFKRRPKTTQKLNYSVNRSSREQLQAEVDRILDKINSKGFGSLSDTEKETLDRAKEILSK